MAHGTQNNIVSVMYQAGDFTNQNLFHMAAIAVTVHAKTRVSESQSIKTLSEATAG